MIPLIDVSGKYWEGIVQGEYERLLILKLHAYAGSGNIWTL